MSFDKVLIIIELQLLPVKRTAKYFVPPLIKLCLGLHVLAGGSYLDLFLAMMSHIILCTFRYGKC